MRGQLNIILATVNHGPILLLMLFIMPESLQEFELQPDCQS